MNPAEYKDDDVVRYAKGIVAEKAADPMATGITWVEERFAHTIARLSQRITWLETELDHSSYVVSMATEYCRTMKPEGLTMLSHTVKQYWNNSLDDDGLADIHDS